MAEDTVWSTPESARISNAMENLENRVLALERKIELLTSVLEELAKRLKSDEAGTEEGTAITKIQKTSGGPLDSYWKVSRP